MGYFILEEQINNVKNEQTKEILKEVISSYNNGNYRSAVAVLYVATIFDLLQKVITLKEIYKDKAAVQIYDEVKKKKANGKSSEWEETLITKVCSGTKLITDSEKEELLYLKKQRNYVAHPIVNEKDDKIILRNVTKETVASLIRNSFEIVFLRDVILAKNLLEDIILDAREYNSRLKENGMEEYLNYKYFERMTREKKEIMFKKLWERIFISYNESKDKENGKGIETSFQVLKYLYKKDEEAYIKLICNEQDYFQNRIEPETYKQDMDHSSEATKMIYLIDFLKLYPRTYGKFNNKTKEIVKNCVLNMFKNKGEEDIQFFFEATALFMAEDYQKHFEKYLNKDKLDIGIQSGFEEILHQSLILGCKDECLNFIIRNYTRASTYIEAHSFFDQLMYFEKYFGKKHYEFILVKMNSNSQFYENRDKENMCKRLEESFQNNHGEKELLSVEDKAYVFHNLYNTIEMEGNKKDLLQYVEKFACYFESYQLINFFVNLEQVINRIISCEKLSEDIDCNIKSYPKILKASGIMEEEVEAQMKCVLKGEDHFEFIPKGVPYENHCHH